MPVWSPDSILALPEHEFWLAVALAAGAAVYTFHRVWYNFKRARVIEDMPTARVRSAAQGYVELEGTCRAMEGLPVVAPLTHTVCLWYRFKIEREVRSSRGGSNWVTVRAGTSDAIFLFEDGTGECIIDPEGAEVVPSVRETWYGRSRMSPPPPPEVRRRRIQIGTGDYRFTEERLEPGPLYVLGWFKSLSAAGVRREDEVAALLRQWKGDWNALAPFDHNRDGEIDVEEWEHVRAAAAYEVEKARAERPAARITHTVVRPPQRDYPYVLSARPQSGLPGRYRWRAGFALAGTFLATAVLVTLLTVRF